MKYESGLTYDELTIGMKASFSKTITETHVSLYAPISGDFNPMHVNEEYSKQARFGRRIAHRAVSQSFIASVSGTKLPGLGTVHVQITVRFRGPTFIGDTVTASAEEVEKPEKKRRARMKLLWSNQRDETILEGEAIVMPPTIK